MLDIDGHPREKELKAWLQLLYDSGDRWHHNIDRCEIFPRRTVPDEDYTKFADQLPIRYSNAKEAGRSAINGNKPNSPCMVALGRAADLDDRLCRTHLLYSIVRYNFDSKYLPDR